MLALHTWTLDTTPLAEVLRVARRVGWDGIELRRVDFARAAEQGQSAADVLALVRTSGLPVACVGVEFGWMYAEGAERRRLLQVFDGNRRLALAAWYQGEASVRREGLLPDTHAFVADVLALKERV